MYTSTSCFCESIDIFVLNAPPCPYVGPAGRPAQAVILFDDFASRESCSLFGQNVVSFMLTRSNSRFCRKTSYGMPLTTSIIRPAVLMPALLYLYFVPGSNNSGAMA